MNNPELDQLETTIVINPAIPLHDMTPLERLVLSHVFDAGELDGGLLLYSDRGAAKVITLPAEEVVAAYSISCKTPYSEINQVIERCLREQDDQHTTIDVDMTTTSWEFILQDIVDRSDRLFEISVLEWYRHPSQRPDSFGANIMLITATAAVGRCSDDIFEDLRAEREPQRPTEGVRHSPGVPDSAGADPVLARMQAVIDRQMEGEFPDENFILDSRGRNSLTTIRRFIESFDTPLPTNSVRQSRELETALCCWETMLDFRTGFENDQPVVRNIHAMMQLWSRFGSIALRRWANLTAILVLEIYDHLGSEPIENDSPFDYGFVPAALEVLTWTEEGPELPGPIDQAAARVMKKLAADRESAS